MRVGQPEAEKEKGEVWDLISDLVKRTPDKPVNLPVRPVMALADRSRPHRVAPQVFGGDSPTRSG